MLVNLVNELSSQEQVAGKNHFSSVELYFKAILQDFCLAAGPIWDSGLQYLLPVDSGVLLEMQCTH